MNSLASVPKDKNQADVSCIAVRARNRQMFHLRKEITCLNEVIYVTNSEAQQMFPAMFLFGLTKLYVPTLFTQ